MTTACPTSRCCICSRHRPDPETGECTARCEPKRADAGLVCSRCRSRMRAALADLPDLYALAADELEPGRGGSGTSTERTLGLNVGALDLRNGAGLIGTLFDWARLWADDIAGVEDWSTLDDRYSVATAMDVWGRGQAEPTSATLTGVVDFLVKRLDWACANFLAIDEFSAEVAKLHRAAQEGARQQPPSTTGVTCPNDTDEGICGYRMTIPAGSDARSVHVCNRCRRHWQLDRLVLVTLDTKGASVWLAADECAALFGISESTLRRLARAPGSAVVRERGLYDVASVREQIASGLSVSSA